MSVQAFHPHGVASGLGMLLRIGGHRAAYAAAVVLALWGGSFIGAWLLG